MEGHSRAVVLARGAAYIRACALACTWACVGVIGLGGCVFYLNPLCNDQIKNGDETGVDCGGKCGPCNLGEGCRVDKDCDEGNCKGGVCTAFPCDNGMKDEAETDVDCGGGTCRKCSGGRTCADATDCFSGMCVAATNTCFSLATVSFADAVHYPSGDKTYALFSGDLNGDGHVDLVAANEQANSLSVYLSTGDSTGALQTVASEATAFLTGFYPTGGAIIGAGDANHDGMPDDLNHDGIPDVITADYHGDSVSVLLGTGTGALAPKVSYRTIVGGETSNLSFGDLNGDGNVDVVAANPSTRIDVPGGPPDGSISVFLGHLDGTFAPAITTPVGLMKVSHPYSTAIADFDGNGIPDVAIGDLVNGPILVKLGNGDGTFQPEVQYSARAGGPFIIIAADINLDGKPDLVTANRGSDNISVLLGRGDGTFKKAIVSSTGDKTNPYSIAVADFNLDGVPDLVTANYIAGTGTVLLGVGDGHFEPLIDAGPTATAKGQISYGVAVGDFNGDGKPDFATTNPGDNDIAVKLSTSH